MEIEPLTKISDGTDEWNYKNILISALMDKDGNIIVLDKSKRPYHNIKIDKFDEKKYKKANYNHVWVTKEKEPWWWKND
jgi:hypothetical protein